MNRSALLAAALLLVPAGCGEPDTPANVMAAADAAARDGDHEKAFELYERLLHWDGEGAVSETDRFKASLESVRALIRQGRSGEAVERFKAVYDEFPGEMGKPTAYRSLLSVLDAMAERPASTDEEKKAAEANMTALLELANEKHPDQKEAMQKYVAALIQKLAPSDDMVARLRELGYL